MITREIHFYLTPTFNKYPLYFPMTLKVATAQKIGLKRTKNMIKVTVLVKKCDEIWLKMS